MVTPGPCRIASRSRKCCVFAYFNTRMGQRTEAPSRRLGWGSVAAPPHGGEGFLQGEQWLAACVVPFGKRGSRVQRSAFRSRLAVRVSGGIG